MTHHRPVPPAERTYRRIGGIGHLTAFQVVVKETDLHVQASRDLAPVCREAVIAQRGYLERFIRQHPDFLTRLAPWPHNDPAPRLVREMIAAAHAAGVGPMAAVAGGLADVVGRQLLTMSDEVVVENGGDLFLAVHEAVTVGIDAGASPLSRRVGLRLEAAEMPMALCTSSGTVGHSLSYGRAEAVCAVARNGALADAAATAVANRIHTPDDLADAMGFARQITDLVGVVAICRDQLGAWGQVAIVPVDPQKDRLSGR
jgi:ApbE superfamily uncharacterized protein (UPF0280 family)